MGGRFVEQDINDRALCPMTMAFTLPGYSPQVDRHREWIKIQDEIYDDIERFPRDGDGDLTGGTEMELAYNKAVSELAEERLGMHVADGYGDYMYLHTVSVTPAYRTGRNHQNFVSAYLICPICLFVLPGEMKA